MSSRSAWKVAATLLAITALAVAVVSAPAGAQNDDAESGDGEVLRIGWGADPQSLNPFVALDEEAYTVWAMTWDLLVNFSTEDLSPTEGIAESWEVSEDQKTVTFTLADRKWSDGEPITSADVKYSLETLGEEGDLFTSYTNNVTSIETPDDQTVVIETRKPDARIVGGLFIYMLPEHIWGEVPLDEVTRTYQPELPMVGSGPFIVTEYERGRILRLERNPNWEGEEPAFDEIQFIKYGTEDAVERALMLGEIDMDLEVQPATFERLGTEPNIETVRSADPAYTELAFNLCSEENCPDAQFNPAIQDTTVRQAIAYAIDRERVVEISSLGTSFVANGILPAYYKAFYEEPEQTYQPSDVELANQMLDEAGWQDNGDGPRTKGGEELSFDLYVRSESQSDIQAARLIVEMAAGDRGRVQPPGGEHRQADRAHGAEGRRSAGAGLRHFRLGLGRRSIRPELPAQPVHDRRDRCLLGRLLLEPRVRPAVRGAVRGVRRRGAQGDHPGDGCDDAGGRPLCRPDRGPQPGRVPQRPAGERRARLSGRDRRSDLRAGLLRAIAFTRARGGLLG